jgi:DNA modification methylase
MYQAALEEGYTHVPVEYCALDEKLSKAYLVADNETARRAVTEQDQLNSLLQEISEIPDFDIESVGFSVDDIDLLIEHNPNEFNNEGEFQAVDEQQLTPNEAKTTLFEKFLIPPFSVLDTRQGYWQKRKKAWNILIGDNGESRDGTLGFASLCNNDKYSGHGNTKTVSILDAVLAELCNLWFNIPEGKNFDCFAGDSVFGFVSGYMGHDFTGIELRPEQAAYNQERCNVFNLPCKYINGDGQNILNNFENESMDFLFSCPPYYDLEVYSDLHNDASNQGTYEEFLNIIDNAFSGAIKCLKENRFAVIVVGDIRDKKGYYRRFPDDIKSIFDKNGMKLYNELILLNVAGTAPIRAAQAMRNRKVLKVHQNVLVFYKGDVAQIQKIFTEIKFDSILVEGDNNEL